MEDFNIIINDYITCNKGVTSDEGEPIRQIILDHFKSGNSVTLDFEGVEMLTTAFLNVVIGELYSTYSSDQLRALLHFRNYTEVTARRIKKVTDTAKAFYNNPDNYNNILNSVLDGNA